MSKQSKPSKSYEGMVPLGLSDAPPDDPRLALAWIQASAGWLAGEYVKVHQKLLDIGPSTPGATLKDDLELHRRTWRQELQPLDDRIIPLYAAVERFLLDLVTPDFWRVCRNPHVVQKNLGAAVGQWERLAVEVGKRLYAPRNGGVKTERIKRGRRRVTLRPLTGVQRQVLELYTKHNGKVTEIAGEMGKSRQAVDKTLKAVWRKLPELAPKRPSPSRKTCRLPVDKRGQVNV